jgi:hypothetical protein
MRRLLTILFLLPATLICAQSRFSKSAPFDLKVGITQKSALRLVRASQWPNADSIRRDPNGITRFIFNNIHIPNVNKKGRTILRFKHSKLKSWSWICESRLFDSATLEEPNIQDYEQLVAQATKEFGPAVDSGISSGSAARTHFFRWTEEKKNKKNVTSIQFVESGNGGFLFFESSDKSKRKRD